MENMTCEQYVLNELKNSRKILFEMQGELCKLKNENAELKDFLNRLLLKVKLDKTYIIDEDIATLRLCSVFKNEKKLLEEIKKYKQEYEMEKL